MALSLKPIYGGIVISYFQCAISVCCLFVHFISLRQDLSLSLWVCVRTRVCVVQLFKPDAPMRYINSIPCGHFGYIQRIVQF